MAILLSFSLFASSCGDDGKNVEACDASFKTTCVGNVAQTCVDKKLVKTDCGTKTCTAGICVEAQTDVCDATFKATCVGNVAQTCVDKKLVKTDCGTDPCTAGVCVVTEPAQGNACTNDICHKGQLYRCDGKVYEAPINCGPGKVCSTDSMHISYCLESCSEAENGHTKKVCEDDYGPYLASMICGLDSLGQYVYDENLKEKPVDCPASCSNGECVKLTQDDGTACDFKKFEERCEAGFVVYCGERYDSKNDKYFYVVSTFVCDVEQVPAVSCQIKKETNYAACVAPCTQGDPIKGKCERDYISYTLHTNACTEAKGDTSAYYYFPSESSENCKTCDEKTLSCTK